MLRVIGQMRLLALLLLLRRKKKTLDDFAKVSGYPINENTGFRYLILNAMQNGMEHFQMIFTFGRFPHRNEGLGRETMEKEKATWP